MKQYLIRVNRGYDKGEAVWTERRGDKFVRGTCIRLAIRNAEIEYTEEDVTVLDTREI